MALAVSWKTVPPYSCRLNGCLLANPCSLQMLIIWLSPGRPLLLTTADPMAALWQTPAPYRCQSYGCILAHLDSLQLSIIWLFAGRPLLPITGDPMAIYWQTSAPHHCRSYSCLLAHPCCLQLPTQWLAPDRPMPPTDSATKCIRSYSAKFGNLIPCNPFVVVCRSENRILPDQTNGRRRSTPIYVYPTTWRAL